MDDVAEALTALASNFSDRSQIDPDLQEKALAIALALRPLHPAAREAHRRLLAGRRPEPLEHFASLNAVSDVLWKHAEILSAAEAEPEDQQLAPKLMELALLIRPDDPIPEHQLAFQKAAEVAPLNWNRFVELQPRLHSSNARAVALFGKVEIADAGSSTGTTPKPPVTNGNSNSGPSNPEMTPNTAPPGDDNSQISEIQLTEGALTYLGLDGGTGQTIGGVASYVVRDPNEDESSLFNLFVDTETRSQFEMRAIYDRDGPTVRGLDRVEKWTRLRYPKWPKEKLAEFTFRGPAGAPVPSELDLGLPALFLLNSAFSGTPINESFGPAREFVLTGELVPDKQIGMPSEPRLVEFVSAAAGLANSPQVLFVPDPDQAVEAQLLDAAIAGSPELLLRPQVVVFESLESAQALVLGETPPELATAVEDFRQIQALTETMDVGNIARNEFVQNKLNAILESWPQHLSAKALLAYGIRPVDLTMSPAATLEAVTAVMKPAADYYQSQIDGTGTGVVPDIEEMVDETHRQLTDLRTKTADSYRPYLAAAERTIDAFGSYFSLNNPDSSLGRQRHRELQELVTALGQEEAKLRASIEGEEEEIE